MIKNWLNGKNAVTNLFLVSFAVTWAFIGINFALLIGVVHASLTVGAVVAIGVVVFTILTLLEGRRSSNLDQDSL